MADHGRNDTDERRGRTDARGREDGIFGRGWSGFGPDPREARGGGEGRGWSGRGGGFDEERGGGFRGRRDPEEDRRERSASWFDPDRDSGREHGERGGRDFGYDDRHSGLPIDETDRLIASNKVEGTPVYSRDRERLGTIYNFMVDKFSGQVEYAVLRYGGFLGMGQRYYPLPWRVLTYHRDAGGYVIDMPARDFEDAPSFDRDSEPAFDREYGRRVHSWYGLDY